MFRRLLAGALVPAVAATALALDAGPSQATPRPWPGHPGRGLVHYTVHSGDTATELAVRFHAWTAELIRLNHLDRTGGLAVGRHLRIPVVLAALPRHSHHGHHHWYPNSRMNRHQVKRAIVRAARRHDVPPHMALAIGWQESGWFERVVSSAGAIGVMQLLPTTARWMSEYAGHRLHLRNTTDNVLGGVLLLRWLRTHTTKDKYAIAAYYQGLGAVRHHGMYADTKRYVHSVRQIRHNLHRTGSPVG